MDMEEHSEISAEESSFSGRLAGAGAAKIQGLKQVQMLQANSLKA